MTGTFLAANGPIHRELARLLAAVQYFTRLPVPAWVGHSQALLDDAARYFPAVGLLVGAIGAVALAGASSVWPPVVAVVLSTIATVLVTGAFHEDGLADTVDGLGGSHERARALEIMKDSRIGTFGALALVLAIILKIALLATMPLRTALLALLAAHASSRLCAVWIAATLPYVREDGTSRSKPLVQRITAVSLGVATLTGVVAVAPLQVAGAVGAGTVLVVGLAWRQYLRRRLDGYTGDCLGAAQQLSECAFYLACVAVA